MAENKQRQNYARTSDLEWDENAIRRGEVHDDWDDNQQFQQQPRLTRTGNTNGNYNEQGNRYSDNFTHQGSSFGGFRNNEGRNFDGNTRNAGFTGGQYNSGRNYNHDPYNDSYNQGHNQPWQNQHSNWNQGQQQSQHDHDGRSNRSQFGPYNEQYNQPYNTPYNQHYTLPYNQQSNQPYGQNQPFGQNQQQQNGYTPGRWNAANMQQNQGWEGQPWNTPNSLESSWNQRSNSSMGINEHGSLISSGPHRGKGPKGYQRSDDRIKEDINDRLMDDAILDASDIEVEVENSEVVLSGTVNSRDAKRRAEDICESISGVTNVENHLRISKDYDRKHSGSSGAEAKNKRSTLAGSSAS